MRFPHFPGVGGRIRERLIELGYVRRDGRPDVARFIRERGYDPRYFYAWIKGRTPTGSNLDRLASDLQVRRPWLLMGEGPKSARKTVVLALLAFSATVGSAAAGVPTRAEPYPTWTHCPDSAHYVNQRHRRRVWRDCPRRRRHGMPTVVTARTAAAA